MTELKKKKHPMMCIVTHRDSKPTSAETGGKTHGTCKEACTFLWERRPLPFLGDKGVGEFIS